MKNLDNVFGLCRKRVSEFYLHEEKGAQLLLALKDGEFCIHEEQGASQKF